MLKKVYGQTIGQFASAKPTLIENPELLRLQHNGGADSEADTEAGEERGTNKASSASVVKGPLDKQIEMKTSDGRRRITPIFILPNSEAANSMMANPVANGTNGNSTSSESLAKYHMQSSSSGAKSKIRIEKVDGVVEPNVSPGKKKEGKSNTAIISTSSTTSTPVLPPAPKANMIAIKHKPGPVNSSNPAIKTASVPSKPTSASSSDQQGSNTNTDSSDSQSAKVKVKKPGDKEKEEKTKKKKANRIESSTDSSDSSESDSSSSSSDDETASQTSKSGTEKEEKKSEQPTKKPGSIIA